MLGAAMPCNNSGASLQPSAPALAIQLSLGDVSGPTNHGGRGDGGDVASRSRTTNVSSDNEGLP